MHHTIRLTLVLATMALLALPSSALATPSITTIAPETVAYGSSVVVTGSVSPVAAGEQVQLQQRINGVWVNAGAVATTTASGTWSTTFNPRVSGVLRAVQLTGTADTSTESSIAVAPVVTSATRTSGRVYPFLGTTATWRVAPATQPNRKVRIKLSLGGRATGYVAARIRNGVVTARIPSSGVGTIRATLQLPATTGFVATEGGTITFAVTGSRVGSGSSAIWNRSLRAALRFRGFHVPGGSGFDSRMGESVIAFHKAYGRPRTTTFEASDWKRLTQRKVGVRDRSTGLHIEIDKARQILMQVRNGKPIFVIHVSTGATGNTPVGRWKIQWKGDWVPSLYGSLLYKSMSVVGGYAIHGYPSVPTVPASHGCIRVPMWIAATLYRRTPVGTPVFIYEGPGGAPVSVGRHVGARDVPELTGVDPAAWAD